MGDFDSTCAVSGLPIEGGAPVRLLLLQQWPTGAPAPHEVRTWSPRALPVQATYNGYGAAEDVANVDGALAANWLDGFRVDLFEKGVGPNVYHDVAVDKRMDFPALLTALAKRRVEVRRHIETPAERRVDAAKVSAMLKGRLMLPRGIPTLRRIERAIARAGAFTYTVSPGNAPRDTLTVRGPGGVYRYTPPGKTDYQLGSDPWRGFGLGTAKSEAADGTGTFSYPLAASHHAESGFTLERVGRGEVIARVKSLSPIAGAMMLHALAKHLRRRYAVMVSPGGLQRGRAAHPAEARHDGWGPPLRLAPGR